MIRVRSAEETINGEKDPKKPGTTAWLCKQYDQEAQDIREAQTLELAPELNNRQQLLRARDNINASLGYSDLRIEKINDKYKVQHDQNTAKHANNVRTHQKELLPVVDAAVSELQAKVDPSASVVDSSAPRTFDGFN